LTAGPSRGAATLPLVLLVAILLTRMPPGWDEAGPSDRAFLFDVVTALTRLLPSRETPPVMGRELAAALAATTGFRPVALCVSDGSDRAGSASEAVRGAYAAMRERSGLPAEIAAFENAGSDRSVRRERSSGI
jgi:hypothetical protein